MTLPGKNPAALQDVDPDRGHAIVKLAQRASRNGRPARPAVEIVKVTSNKGLIVIGPCNALRQIPFLHLVEIASGRFLLALDPTNDFNTLEIAVNDVLDDMPAGEEPERKLIVQLLEHIKNLRKSERVSMAKILFVSLEGNANAGAIG